MAETIIENLVTRLSFKADTETLKKFDKGVKQLAIGLTAVVAAATAATGAIFSFTKGMAQSQDELGKFAQITDASIETIQELGFAAELNGGSIGSMNASLSNLSQRISEASRGIGEGVETFGILGISVVDAQGKIKSVDGVLNEISDSMARLGTNAERIEFARKLGINEDLILTLKNGSAELDRLRQRARDLGFIIGEDAAKAAADFNDELFIQSKLLEGVKNIIGTDLIKQFTPFLVAMNKWVQTNQKLISQKILFFLDKFKLVTMGLFNIGVRVVSVIDSLAQSMGGWKNAILVVSAALLAMNASALLMPVLALAAAAAIFLIIEDIQKFADGGDSALGNLADRFPIIDTLLKGLLFTLGKIVEGWKLIFTQGDEAFFGLIEMIKDASKWTKELGQDIINFLLVPINQLIEQLNRIPGINIETIEQVGTGEQEGRVIQAAQFSADLVGAFVTQPILDLVNSQLGTAFGRIAQAERRSFIPAGASSITNNNTTNTSNPNITLNIMGNNPEQIGVEVERKLTNIFNGAQENFSSQVEF